MSKVLAGRSLASVVMEERVMYDDAGREAGPDNTGLTGCEKESGF